MTYIEPDRIDQHLNRIHARLAEIAEIEARAAWVGGYGSQGEFNPERQRLIEETDRILDIPKRH